MTKLFKTKIGIVVIKHQYFLSCAVIFLGCGVAFCDLKPIELRCEYSDEPLAVQTSKPRLSWILESNERNQKQTAYQIQVSTTPDTLASNQPDQWDSGKVSSDQSIQIVYTGSALQSDTTYYWKVQVWDRQGIASPWSKPAQFTIGYLSPDDWQAQWIAAQPEDQWRKSWNKRKEQEFAQMKTKNSDNAMKDVIRNYKGWQLWDLYKFPEKPYDPAPLLRKEFSLSQSIRQARIHVSGLGYYELYLNGRKVGDHVLDPGWTKYDKRVLYVTYDVTDQLKQGKNVVGLMLGRGWYNPITVADWHYYAAPWVGQPKAILELKIISADGSETKLLTDETWKVADSPIIYDDQRVGEIYDARLEEPGWDTAGYDDSSWTNASFVPAPKGALHAQMVQPIKVTNSIKPVKLTNPQEGIYVFDLGQNITGLPQLSLDGTNNQGRRILISMSSRLKPDGTLKPYSFADRRQQAIYIIKGEDQEIYHPRFTYYGFQYVQVENFPGTPTLDNLTGLHVHTAVENTGSFSCSNELVNRLQDNIRRTQLNNMHSIPTDCPNREKLGWAADAHVTTEEAIFNFNCPQFYTKYINDMYNGQGPKTGRLCCVNPSTYNADNESNRIGNVPFWFSDTGVAWSSAYILMQWYLYQYYGDERLLEEQYTSLQRWIDSIEKDHGTDKPYIISGPYGDWVAPYQYGPSPLTVQKLRISEMVNTAYYQYGVSLMSRIARVLGRTEDVDRYTQWAQNIAQAMNQRYFDPASETYNGGFPAPYLQTPNAFALFLNIVPEDKKPAVIRHLLQDILVDKKGHLNTGFPGTKVLMEILPQLGHADVAYTILTRRDYPSWFYHILAYNATTIPEDWSGNTPLNFPDPRHVGGTRNHPAFGSVGAYFYKYLAGIQTDPQAVAFKHIIIKPCIEGDLSYARADYDSIRGTITSRWERQNASFIMNVSIPANTTATVWVPKDSRKDPTIKENGKSIWSAGKFQTGVDGFKSGNNKEKYVVFNIGSGDYNFKVK